MSLFNLNARVGRLRALVVLAVALGTILALQFAVEQNVPWLRYLAPALVLAVILQFVVVTQRMHDANRSGYWALFVLVPFANLVLFVVALVLPSAQAWQPAARRLWSHRLAYLGFALLLVLALLRVFFQISWIPSGSMKPTLLVGDAFIIPLTGQVEIQRGDIAIFRHPLNGMDYVKRVIGLPGDTIQLQDGVVIINGTATRQTPEGDFTEVREPQGALNAMPRCRETAGKTCTKTLLHEELPDQRTHAVLDMAVTAQDNTPLYTVPPGHYFMLGDNRDDSTDSRFPQAQGGLGFVPAANIRGKVSTVLFSSAGAQLFAFWTWRPERFLLGLQ